MEGGPGDRALLADADHAFKAGDETALALAGVKQHAKTESAC